MNGWLVGLLILAVLAVAVAPAMALWPNPRQRRLAAMRLAARQLGFSVTLEAVPDLAAPASSRVSAGARLRTPRRRMACYSLPLASVDGDNLPDWLLLRQSDVWVGDARAADLPGPPNAVQATLAPLLSALPADAMAVQCRGRQLGCCWLEQAPANADSVAQLKEALSRVAAGITAARAAECASPPRPPLDPAD